MKKKAALIITSVFILVVAVTLFVAKPSYSSPIGNPSCPTTLEVEASDEEITLIKTDYEEISLPKEINTYNRNGSLYDSEGLLLNRNTTKYNELKEQAKFDNLTDYISMFIPDVSTDPYENRYYRQLILWFYMDMMKGMDLEHNYIDGEELPMESNSSEKYDSYGNYIFDNALSALEKKAILESENGKIVVDTLDKIFNYFEWLETEEGQNTTDPKLYLNEIDTSKITLSIEDSYLETSLIYPTSVDDYAIGFTHYKVKVDSPFRVVDEDGNERTEFKSMEGFRVQIPADQVNDNKVKFDFTVQGITRDQQTFVYFPMMEVKKEPGYYTSPLPPGTVVNCNGDYEDVETYQPLHTTYEVSGGTITVNVIDAATHESISGAEVTIYNSAGNIVFRKTTAAKVLTVMLPPGEYVVKQTVTPPNYEPITIQQRVEVTSGSSETAVLENTPLVNVPDTSMTAKYIPVVGFATLIIGILILGFIIKNKNTKKEH